MLGISFLFAGTALIFSKGGSLKEVYEGKL
jgi:hypothetical protein